MFMLAAGGAMAGMQAFQAYKASKAKAAAEMTQYNDRMMKQSMSSGVEMFNNAQANANRMVANKNIASAAIENLMRQQSDSTRMNESAKTNMARGLETQTQAVRNKAANKLGRNSGTFKLAVDKMKETGATAFAQQSQNEYRTAQDQERQYQNNLSQRDLMTSNQTAALIPGLPPVQPNHTAAAIQGGMQGMQQGMSMASSFGNALKQTGLDIPKWMLPVN